MTFARSIIAVSAMALIACNPVDDLRVDSVADVPATALLELALPNGRRSVSARDLGALPRYEPGNGSRRNAGVLFTDLLEAGTDFDTVAVFSRGEAVLERLTSSRGCEAAGSRQRTWPRWFSTWRDHPRE